MGFNYCRKCGAHYGSPGSGRIHDPSQPWWKFWRTIECPDCGGDGYAKPPGWPDPVEMDRQRPSPPPPPPPVRSYPLFYPPPPSTTTIQERCPPPGKPNPPPTVLLRDSESFRSKELSEGCKTNENVQKAMGIAEKIRNGGAALPVYSIQVSLRDFFAAHMMQGRGFIDDPHAVDIWNSVDTVLRYRDKDKE